MRRPANCVCACVTHVFTTLKLNRLNRTGSGPVMRERPRAETDEGTHIL